MQGVTEGRIVHYVAYNHRHLAAIVTGKDTDERVDLAVFTNMRNVNGEQTGGLQFHFRVPYGAALDNHLPEPGTWHWPERDTEPESKA